MTLKEFNTFKENINKECDNYQKKYPFLSKGEIIFNLTKKEFPATVNRIKNTQADPTDNDNNITQFWNLLQRKLITS